MYTNSKLGIKVLIFWLGMISFIFSLGFFIASRFSYSNRNAMHSCEKLISTVSNVGDVYYDIDYNSPSYDSDGNEISSESWDVFYYFDFEISWLYGDNALNESVKRQVGHDTFSHKPRQYDLDCDYYMLFVEHNYFIYRTTDEMIVILEIFHEREYFIYQMFGIVTTSQETLDYWGED